MKSNPFNICPTCIYSDTCVITHHKNQVCSCSEYQEGKAETTVPPKLNKIAQPEMAMI